MDWLCPEWTSKLGALLKEHHGRRTPEVTIRDITARVQTGDLHIAIYSAAMELLHFSLSAGSEAAAGAPRKAYARPFMKLDLSQFWAIKPPMGGAKPLKTTDAEGGLAGQLSVLAKLRH
eukprot:SAG11_NODE_14212_length_621_cov_1.166667_1_plen_118_part_01